VARGNLCRDIDPWTEDNNDSSNMATVIESNDAAMPPEQKYFVEAAKRKRAEGTKQFEQLHFSESDRLRSLAEDPWVNHAALDNLQLPIHDGNQVKFLITGAGMGGITMAIKLIKAGFTADQFLIVETAGGIGGTWYWNRYPGLHCKLILSQKCQDSHGLMDLLMVGDIESYCYVPFLEDTGYMPKQKYASGVEIRTYLEDLVKQFGLQDRIIFRSQVDKLQWDERDHAWHADITIRRGPEGKEQKDLSIRADFVTLASGLFPYPQVPRVPGLKDFSGQMFHTSRWNYDITGGTCDNAFPKMKKLEGLRVGIIGTGATAIQVVPQLAKYAKELYVFQRTPSQVNSRDQRDTDPKEWREHIAAKSGWQKDRLENLADNISGDADVNLVNDEWSKLAAYCALVGSNKFGRIAPEKAQEHISRMVTLDAEHNKKARERVSRVVKDKKTAEKLTAWYPTWCKRPTFSDLYLETYNNENVHLIDTDGKGIESVTSNGIVANGQEHPIDILVLSTGYRSPSSGGSPGARTNIEIIGRDGRHMSEKWETQGICTLHGVCSNGFPNLFWQYPAQAGATANYMHVIDVLSEHIAGIIAQGVKRASGDSQRAVIEATAAAEEAWGMQIAQTAAYFSSIAICTPSYNTLEGEALEMPAADDHVGMMKKAKAAIWQGGIVDFARTMEKWRQDEKLDGMEVSVA
jgi:cation diffusion facilitator CzcD-associated flavoprotein CzcO